jgi:hypothetical protein
MFLSAKAIKKLAMQLYNKNMVVAVLFVIVHSRVLGTS